MEEKNFREKVSRFIYKNGVNTSSRDRTTAIDNDKIDDNALISVINFGVDLDRGTIEIRARFHGSQTFYSISFDITKYDEWADRIKQLYKESNVDIDDIDDELDF